MNTYDIVIIGAGPAGLAAAIAAKEAGVDDVLVIERDSVPGGILNQCIHNGFGLHTFREELTGPEYAARFLSRAGELGVAIRLSTMVLSLSNERVLTVTSRERGVEQLRARAVILAMGCRERPRGALNIPGYRPAGIYCPMGCAIHVEMENGQVVSVTGNTCPRGAEYAKSEATAPVRTVTSTVRALGGVRPVVAAKTVPDVPKDRIFDVMDAVRALEVTAPVHIGDILCANIAGTGSDLVAAADLDAE